MITRSFCYILNSRRLHQTENNFAFRPEIFQPVKISLLGGKKMYNNITIIQENPTQVGLTFR